jgi:hypothetical protein
MLQQQGIGGLLTMKQLDYLFPQNFLHIASSVIPGHVRILNSLIAQLLIADCNFLGVDHEGHFA